MIVWAGAAEEGDVVDGGAAVVGGAWTGVVAGVVTPGAGEVAGAVGVEVEQAPIIPTVRTITNTKLIQNNVFPDIGYSSLLNITPMSYRFCH